MPEISGKRLTRRIAVIVRPHTPPICRSGFLPFFLLRASHVRRFAHTNLPIPYYARRQPILRGVRKIFWVGGRGGALPLARERDASFRIILPKSAV